MATLGSLARKQMPRKNFGLPKTRGFPMEDAKHDRLAISGATRSERAGNISRSTEERLKAEARAKLAKAKGKGR